MKHRNRAKRVIPVQAGMEMQIQTASPKSNISIKKLRLASYSAIHDVNSPMTADSTDRDIGNKQTPTSYNSDETDKLNTVI